MLPFCRKGVPYPFLITPQCDNEAKSGHATLLTDGQIETLVGALRESPRWHDDALIIKLEALRAS